MRSTGTKSQENNFDGEVEVILDLPIVTFFHVPVVSGCQAIVHLESAIYVSLGPGVVGTTCAEEM